MSLSTYSRQKIFVALSTGMATCIAVKLMVVLCGLVTGPPYPGDDLMPEARMMFWAMAFFIPAMGVLLED